MSQPPLQADLQIPSTTPSSVLNTSLNNSGNPTIPTSTTTVDVQCVQCLKIPKDAVESLCGCRQIFCSACAKGLNECPSCHTKPFQALANITIRRLVGTLLSECRYCSEMVKNEDIETHLSHCDQRPKICGFKDCTFASNNLEEIGNHLFAKHRDVFASQFEICTKALTDGIPSVCPVCGILRRDLASLHAQFEVYKRESEKERSVLKAELDHAIRFIEKLKIERKRLLLFIQSSAEERPVPPLPVQGQRSVSFVPPPARETIARAWHFVNGSRNLALSADRRRAVCRFSVSSQAVRTARIPWASSASTSSTNWTSSTDSARSPTRIDSASASASRTTGIKTIIVRENEDDLKEELNVRPFSRAFRFAPSELTEEQKQTLAAGGLSVGRPVDAGRSNARVEWGEKKTTQWNTEGGIERFRVLIHSAGLDGQFVGIALESSQLDSPVGLSEQHGSCMLSTEELALWVNGLIRARLPREKVASLRTLVIGTRKARAAAEAAKSQGSGKALGPGAGSGQPPVSPRTGLTGETHIWTVEVDTRALTMRFLLEGHEVPYGWLKLPQIGLGVLSADEARSLCFAVELFSDTLVEIL